MTLILQDEMTFKDNQDAFEKASLFFSRIERLASTAMVINEQKHGEFKNPLYREDCVFYQLEAIRDLAGQFDDVFSDLAISLGRKCDLRLQELESAAKLIQGESESEAI